MKKLKFIAILVLLLGLLFSTTTFSQSLTTKNVYIYTNTVAKIYISGHYKGTTKYKYKDKNNVTWYYIKLKLKVGNYPLKIEKSGYKTIYTKITVRSTGSNKFFYKLKREQTQTTTTTTTSKGVGTLVINTDIPVWVYLNKIKLGKTPFNKKIKAGTYTLLLVPLDTKYPKKSMTIKIEAGRTTTITQKFLKKELIYNVQIVTNVRAYVYINGSRQNGTTPMTLKLKKGTYQLKLVPVEPYYNVYQTTINVSKNSVLHFNLQAKTVSVTFNIPSNASVYVNNKKVPIQNYNYVLNLLPGRYKIKIVYYDFVIEKEITINFNKPLTITLFMDFQVED